VPQRYEIHFTATADPGAGFYAASQRFVSRQT